MKIISRSVEETHAVASRLGGRLQPNSVLCFFGDLGSGKTTFIKGLAEGAAGIPSAYVNSPTFTYLNIYEGRQTIYHFDLYRLRDEDEFLSMGFDEYLSAGGICCIEWSERIKLLLPADCIRIMMCHCGGDLREIEVKEVR